MRSSWCARCSWTQWPQQPLRHGLVLAATTVVAFWLALALTLATLSREATQRPQAALARSRIHRLFDHHHRGALVLPLVMRGAGGVHHPDPG